MKLSQDYQDAARKKEKTTLNKRVELYKFINNMESNDMKNLLNKKLNADEMP